MPTAEPLSQLVMPNFSQVANQLFVVLKKSRLRLEVRVLVLELKRMFRGATR